MSSIRKGAANAYADALAVEALLKARLPFLFSQVDLLAPTSQEFVCPFNGTIERLDTIIQAAVTTGGAITVLVNTVAVDGLSITVADAATKGTRQFDEPTPGHATTAVKMGDRIEIVAAAAFATAGIVSGFLTIKPD